MKINPLHATDFYKVSHRKQYPPGTTLVYSNLTPRSDRLSPIPPHLATHEVTFFGLQFVLKDFLQRCWDDGFFGRPKDEVVEEYRRRVAAALGPGAADVEHVERLHDLGYLPVCIRALPEGTSVPMRVPVLTIHNTHPDFAWLTNYLETALSAYLWKPTTTATIARHYRLLLERYASLTGGRPEFVKFQGHDFSMRGMSGVADAAIGGAGHLTSFVGTDSIPAIDLVEQYYNADVTRDLVGCSVPATEHSVMTSNILRIAGGLDGPEASADEKMAEAEAVLIERLITEVHPNGIVSIVADSFDFWRVVSEILPSLKDEVMARDGKVVVRPDSGSPVDIICGEPYGSYSSLESAREQIPHASSIYNFPGRYAAHFRVGPEFYKMIFSVPHREEEVEIERYEPSPQEMGLIECLWRTFGGTINDKGYRVLDPHVGAIYGDSITLERAEAILKGLEAKGFCSSNIVFGIGSFTYQHVTRDSFGFAVKSTAAVVDGEVVEIYKDPKTDDGAKKSARGFLSVQVEDGRLVLKDRRPFIDMPLDRMREVFRDGRLLVEDDLETIRRRASSC